MRKYKRASTKTQIQGQSLFYESSQIWNSPFAQFLPVMIKCVINEDNMLKLSTLQDKQT